MQSYRFAGDREGYSAAFREYRYVWLREHFNAIGLAIIGLLIVSTVWGKPISRTWQRGLHTVRRWRELDSLWPVVVLLILAVLVRLLSLSALSFPFRTKRPDEIRFIFEAGKVLIPWLTWCVASLAVSEIFYGEGTLRQIVISSAWALWPYIVFALPVSLLTRGLTLDDQTFYRSLLVLIELLMAWEFFRQMQVVHNFDTMQSLVVIALSLVAMFLIWVLLGLIYALTSEIIRFIRQIALEIYVRRF